MAYSAPAHYNLSYQMGSAFELNISFHISEKIKPENHNKYIFDDLLVLFISYLFPVGIDIVKMTKFSVEIQWWLSDLK